MLQAQTIQWIPTWAQAKKTAIASTSADSRRMDLESLGELGRSVLLLIPKDLGLERLQSIQLVPSSDGESSHLSQVRLEFFGEPTVFVTVDPFKNRLVSRRESEGPSNLLRFHTGQFTDSSKFSMLGLWTWTLFGILGLVQVVSGIVLYRSSKLSPD